MVPGARSVLLACVATATSDAVMKQEPTLADYKADKAAEEEAAKQAEADKAKLAAVNKVITMLDDLIGQVLTEGEKEAFEYNKFACFCKDTTREKNAAITKGQDDKTSLAATITDLNEKRDDIDDEIERLTEQMAETDAQLKKATDERKATKKVFEKNAADLESALVALDGAIDVMKASKAPSFVQIQSIAKTVQTATLIADALGTSGAAAAQHRVAVLLQQPDVEMENYKYHADSVIDSLEHLKGDFRQAKQEIDVAEAKSVAEFDAVKQEKVDHLKAKSNDLNAAKKQRDRTTSEVSSNTAQLSTVSADLLDDQKYLSGLSHMCEMMAKTWDQRTRVRADELSALTAATEIVKTTVKEKTSSSTARLAQQGVRVKFANMLVQNEDAMEAFEAEAEAAESAPSFLQTRSARNLLAAVRRSDPDDLTRFELSNFLLKEGGKIRSTLLLTLGHRVKEDPFQKIKQLMQRTIEQLLQEAAEEADSKGWCDKALGDASQKRDLAVRSITEANGRMAELEATRDKLVEEIDVLTVEIRELRQKEREATTMRDDEKAENEAAVIEAQAGLEAVTEAIDILEKFYKHASGEKVDLEFVQQNPMKDAPRIKSFGIGDEYTGGQGESGGILGMLDIIKSDFDRTLSTTDQAEATAQKEYEDFMGECDVSIHEKMHATQLKTKQKDDDIEELESTDEDLHAETEILKVAIQELLNLQPTCVNTAMTFNERVANREREIAALKDTLCMVKFQEKGLERDAAAAKCGVA